MPSVVLDVEIRGNGDDSCYDKRYHFSSGMVS